MTTTEFSSHNLICTGIIIAVLILALIIIIVLVAIITTGLVSYQHGLY